MTHTNVKAVTAEAAVREAEGRIGLAVERVAGAYPFHAKVLERFVVRSRPGVRTMGVTVRGDDVLLLHNPSFVTGITMDELVGVLVHEVHHVVFGHVLADPAAFPDEWARVVAEEVTVNEFITEPLPATPVLLAQFPGLPPMESTRRRYDRLRRHPQRARLLGPSGTVVLLVPGAGSGANGKGVGVVLDDHGVWVEAAADPGRAAAAVRAAVHDAATDVGADGIPEYLRAALAAMGVGRVAGDGKYELDGSGQSSLPWARLLRQYAGGQLRPRPDFRRPPRRRPELVGVVPGKGPRADRPRVMAVIDTSGSITPGLLEQISAELARLAADFAVTVVECDAAVHDVYAYRPLKSVGGRGGTDLRPPLEPAFLRAHRPDLLVYFTDGCGPAPARPPPRVPVIWCLTAGGQEPAGWGRVIRVADAPCQGNA